ncbi:hypothetical protein BGW38_006610, partial [Lunasporangiospora selenospora]
TTSNAFPVSTTAATVGELKKLIKAEKSPEFDDIAADKLTLWRASIPVTVANKHKPIFLSKKIESTIELDPTDYISDVFSKTPKKSIHVLVEPPSQPKDFEVVIMPDDGFVPKRIHFT